MSINVDDFENGPWTIGEEEPDDFTPEELASAEAAVRARMAAHAPSSLRDRIATLVAGYESLNLNEDDEPILFYNHVHDKAGRFGFTNSEAFGISGLTQKGKDAMHADLERRTGMSIDKLNKIVRGNLDVHYQAGRPEDGNWYREGKDMVDALSVKFDVPPDHVAAVIARTSAQMAYQPNVRAAAGLIEAVQLTPQLTLTRRGIDEYNNWASQSWNHAIQPDHNLTPGTYDLHELPSGLIVSNHGLYLPVRSKNTADMAEAVDILLGRNTVPGTVRGPKQRNFTNNHIIPEDNKFVTIDTWHWRAMMGGTPISRSAEPNVRHTLAEWKTRNVDAQKLMQQTSVDGKRIGAYPWAVEQTRQAAQVSGRRKGAGSLTAPGYQAVIWNAIRGSYVNGNGRVQKPTTMADIRRSIGV